MQSSGVPKAEATPEGGGREGRREGGERLQSSGAPKAEATPEAAPQETQSR